MKERCCFCGNEILTGDKDVIMYAVGKSRVDTWEIRFEHGACYRSGGDVRAERIELSAQVAPIYPAAWYGEWQPPTQ